jgi:hypothetical protein
LLSSANASDTSLLFLSKTSSDCWLLFVILVKLDDAVITCELTAGVCTLGDTLTGVAALDLLGCTFLVLLIESTVTSFSTRRTHAKVSPVSDSTPSQET